MEETISLKEIFETLKKRFVLIIALTAVAVTAAGIISYNFLTPMYQASTQILINEAKEEGQLSNAGDINTRANMELISTYNVIMTTPRILEPVISELQLDRSIEALKNQVSVTSEGDSQVVVIRVEDENPAMAVEIANTTAEVFKEDIVEIMNVDNVSVLSPAVLTDNPAPISPNPTLNMAIAMVVGLMAGVGIAFLLEFLDRTIKTEEQVEQLLGLPVLGSISSIDEKNVEVKNLSFTRRNRTGRGENYGS